MWWTSMWYGVDRELAEEFQDKIVCIQVDVDKEENLANEFDITVMPTFILLKDAKQVVSNWFDICTFRCFYRF
ncbi:unnamed protein product [Enterobius vermicularis]|uniref:Thioredoxin domain-containing protein n=1 Tax=Enterobius vermicularis TaxID=51028 RepID=A0A0N4VRQ1_ENTVE|nr:unnamed protein product [Enterobius vermicularis]